MNKFAERFKETLAQSEMTQQALADKLGTTQQTISRWTKGEREPDLDMLTRICFYLNEEPNYMLGYAPEEIAKEEESSEREKVRSLAQKNAKMSDEEEEKLWSRIYLAFGGKKNFDLIFNNPKHIPTKKERHKLEAIQIDFAKSFPSKWDFGEKKE